MMWPCVVSVHSGEKMGSLCSEPLAIKSQWVVCVCVCGGGGGGGNGIGGELLVRVKI